VLSSRPAAPEPPSWGEIWPENPIRIAIDPNGNLIQKVGNGATWTYEWNAENQLTRVMKDSVEVATFSYDPSGRRIEKAVGGRHHAYLYDALGILQEQVTEGATTTSHQYVQGPWIDEPLAREEVAQGILTYLHADGIASIVGATSATGAVLDVSNYDAWGGITTGVTEGGYAYTGREWDPEVDLYYYRFRYYSPESGRFLSEDPIGTIDENLYTYVLNSPLTWLDPMGLRRSVGPWGPEIPREIWKCFCDLWKLMRYPLGKREAGANFYLNPHTKKWYCAKRVATDRDNATTVDPNNPHAHTHPRGRTKEPSYPQDYEACERVYGAVLTENGIYEIPAGCKEKKCVNRVAHGPWHQDCPQ